MSQSIQIDGSIGMASNEVRIPSSAVAALVVMSTISVILVVGWNGISQWLPSVCSQVFGDALPGGGCTAGVGKIFTYAWALALLPVILLMEWWRPANPAQAVFSPAVLVDMLWFFTFPILGVWLLTVFGDVLDGTLGSAVADFRLETVASWPLAVQFAVVILFSDFLSWFGHYVRHKVPVFWEFHKIHHSQTQLNYFSSRRVHPLDMMSNSLIRFLPWTLLGLELALPGFVIWRTINNVFEMFVHSNIRTDLGWLRYVIVTPQTHRVHHSIQPEHMDKNFGNFFSIWDFLFRTQCMDFKVYPELGVDDPNCSRGQAQTLPEAVRVFVSELIYPLRVLAAQIRIPAR